MLVLPAEPCLWSDVISRWESITINRLNSQTWSDNTVKLAFMENLLGESEKLMWQQWRTAYPSAYSALETITYDPQNITSQVRQLIIMEDPYRGSTDEHDRAYKDLDRITCEETKNLWSFLEDFWQKSRKYKGKPYNSHVKPFKRKYKDDRERVKKCKCFIYGKEGHFAKDCKSKQGNIARSAIYQELDLDDKWDIISADFDDSSVYNISKREGDVYQNISIMVQDTPFEEATFMKIKEINESDDEQSVEKDYDDHNSHHAFMFHPGLPTKIADMAQLSQMPIDNMCPLCKKLLGKTVNVKRKQPHKLEEEKDFSDNEVKLLKELLKEKKGQYGDEHLDTILATESDKFIKSSVENHIPIPSESEDECECDVPDWDDSQTKKIQQIVFDNSHADIESFSPSPIPIKDSGSHMEETDLPFTPDDPMPPSIEDDDYDSGRDIPIL
nr:TPA: orf y [Tanacetum cinerariifolium]